MVSDVRAKKERDNSGTMITIFCGTREYVASEMLTRNEHGLSVNSLAFSILLYEVLCGQAPFYSRHRNEAYDRLENKQLEFPRHLSSDVKSLIRRRLDRNLQTRLDLGADVISAIKQQPFFADTNWEVVHPKKASASQVVTDRDALEDTRRKVPRGLGCERQNADVLLKKGPQ